MYDLNVFTGATRVAQALTIKLWVACIPNRSQFNRDNSYTYSVWIDQRNAERAAPVVEAFIAARTAEFEAAFAADEARQDGLETQLVAAALAEPDCTVPLTVDGHNCARYGCR